MAAFAASQGDVWIHHFVDYAGELFDEPGLAERMVEYEVPESVVPIARNYRRQIAEDPPPLGLDEKGCEILAKLEAGFAAEPDAARREMFAEILLREVCYRFVDRLNPHGMFGNGCVH